MKLKERSKAFWVPIYECAVMLVLTNSVKQTLEKSGREAFGGADDDDDETNGVVVRSPNGVYLVAFDRGTLTHGTVSHEVMHLTHRILERAGHKIAPECHEPHAYLNGFLTNNIYKYLKRWKAKIK